jgi:hypothetical protein
MLAATPSPTAANQARFQVVEELNLEEDRTGGGRQASTRGILLHCLNNDHDSPWRRCSTTAVDVGDLCYLFRSRRAWKSHLDSVMGGAGNTNKVAGSTSEVAGSRTRTQENLGLHARIRLW